MIISFSISWYQNDTQEFFYYETVVSNPNGDVVDGLMPRVFENHITYEDFTFFNCS